MADIPEKLIQIFGTYGVCVSISTKHRLPEYMGEDNWYVYVAGMAHSAEAILWIRRQNMQDHCRHVVAYDAGRWPEIAGTIFIFEGSETGKKMAAMLKLWFG